MEITIPRFYEPDKKHWLYFGWENEWPKALSFMGGGLCPNRLLPPILYSLTVNGTEYVPDELAKDRRTAIRWYKEDGWLNCPVSEWDAGELRLRISHAADKLTNAVTVFTKITVTNPGKSEACAVLNVSADAETEVPTDGRTPDYAAEALSCYALNVPAGGSVSLNFAALSNGQADADELAKSGGYDSHLAAVKKHYADVLEPLARPVSLPSAGMVDSYLSGIVTMLETMTRTVSSASVKIADVTVNGEKAAIRPASVRFNVSELFAGGEKGSCSGSIDVKSPGTLESIRAGGRVTFDEVFFPADCRCLVFECACPLSSGLAQGGRIAVTVDGAETPAAVLTVDRDTKEWQKYECLSVPCETIPAGVHAVTLTMQAPASGDSGAFLFNVKDFLTCCLSDENGLPKAGFDAILGIVDAPALGEAGEKTLAVTLQADTACVDYTLNLTDPDRKTVYGSVTFTGENDPQTVEMTVNGPLTGGLCLTLGENFNYEIRGSGGNVTVFYPYDRTFSHDVPNMAEQFVRDGLTDTAKAIFGSSYYQELAYVPEQAYLDAMPKFILPLATLWQLMSPAERADYFTPALKEQLKRAAHVIASYMTGPGGLMAKGNTLDNGSDYLVVDNFAVLHGYAAYRYLCREWGGDWQNEADWATERLETVNSALNRALDECMERRGTGWYMCALDDGCGFWKRHENGSVIYDGNWLGTTFMMSTFPWDAELRGLGLDGTWKDRLDATVDNAFALRKRRGDIPEHSWGAWWGHEYGTIYNVGMSIGLLSSEKYRTEAVKAYEWLLGNQTAPFVWAESFDPGLAPEDWTSPAADLETWGLGFNRQGLLEATVSLKANGDVIIGRGIPCEWTEAGSAPIEWRNIRIGGGRKLDRLLIETSADGKTVVLTLSGDDAAGEIVFDLPVLARGIASVSCGTVDREAGTVTCPGNMKSLTVTLL